MPLLSRAMSRLCARREKTCSAAKPVGPESTSDVRGPEVQTGFRPTGRELCSGSVGFQAKKLPLQSLILNDYCQDENIHKASGYFDLFYEPRLDFFSVTGYLTGILFLYELRGVVGLCS